jgi:hypothetical protein
VPKSRSAFTTSATPPEATHSTALSVIRSRQGITKKRQEILDSIVDFAKTGPAEIGFCRLARTLIIAALDLAIRAALTLAPDPLRFCMDHRVKPGGDKS